MDGVLWGFQLVLGFLFIGAGMMKVVRSHESLRRDPKMAFANDFSGGFIRFIAAAEVAGGLGLILPWLLGVMAVLTPLAAMGLAIIMVGAFATHFRRHEYPMAVVALLLVFACGFVAYGRLLLG